MRISLQPSSNPLLRKLEHFTRLSPEDRAAALRLCAERPQRYSARDDLVREGEAPRFARIVIEGWACRYKHLEDGRRQVVGLFVPGDLCDLNIFVLRQMDHYIGAVTPVTVAQVTREVFEEVTLGHPRLLQALWWDTLVNMAILREWVTNLGARTAYERITHLMCEVFVRLRAAGRTQGLSCEFPLTQVLIADITGLSTVHVSRTLTEIREEGLVDIRDRTLTIRDPDALMRAALFNPDYLHLGREAPPAPAEHGVEKGLLHVPK